VSADDNQQTKLAGQLTPFAFFTIAFGAMVGVGWLPLLGSWLELGGSVGASLSFVVGAALISVIALSYMDVVRHAPIIGGEAAFAHHIIGPFTGFCIGWALVFSFIAVCAFEAITIGWLATSLLPALKGPEAYTFLGVTVYTGPLVIGIMTTAALTVLQVFGTTLTARAQDVLTVIFLIGVVMFVVCGIAFGDAQNLVPYFGDGSPDGWRGVFAVLGVTPVFFGGFNFAVQAILERKDGVTIDQVGTALFAAIALAAMFYVSIIMSAGFASPRALIVAAEMPAVAAFEKALPGHGLAEMVLSVGLVGLLTTWNSVKFATARVLYSMAENQKIPSVFTVVNAKYQTPTFAIVFVAVLTLMGLMAGQGAIDIFVGSASITIAVCYVVVGVCSIIIAKDTSGTIQPRRWLGLAVAIFVLLISLAQPFMKDPTPRMPVAWIAITVWMFMGALFYAATRRKRQQATP